MDEEGNEVKQSPLAKCHLGICTSNIPLSDSDRGEPRYKMQKMPLWKVRGIALQGADPIQERPLLGMWARRAKRIKQPPLATCHLGMCTSNMHLSDSDRGESRYKM